MSVVTHPDRAPSLVSIGRFNMDPGYCIGSEVAFKNSHFEVSQPNFLNIGNLFRGRFLRRDPKRRPVHFPRLRCVFLHP